MTVQLETAPMTLSELDDIRTPLAPVESQTHADEVAPKHNSLVPDFRTLQPGERFVVDTRRPLMSSKEAASRGIQGVPLALLRAGIPDQLGYRPSELLDASNAQFLLIKREGEQREKGDRFAVMTQVQYGSNGESRVYPVLPGKPLQLGRSALAGATMPNGDPIRQPYKLHSEHFGVEYDPQSDELTVVHNKDGHGYGASIAAYEAGADYAPKHMA